MSSWKRSGASFDRLQLRHRPVGADHRLSSFLGPRSIGRSRAVRPARRRPRRSGQAGGRQRHARYRPVRRRDRDQILQGRVGRHHAGRSTSSAAPTPPISNCRKPSAPIARRPTRAARRPWSNSACCSRPGPASPRTKRRRASCSSAPPRPATRAASPISRRSPSSGGAPSDPVQTRALLAKAAETNSAEAQYQLGLMTADGVGGPKDDVAARALFEKAAAQGHPGALERMGAFAQSGRGGPQDASAAKAVLRESRGARQ